VAKVLISEPHPDSRALLELVVERAGHEPVGQGELTNGDQPDLLILEPAAPSGVATALELRRRLGDLPIICASICPPGPETSLLQPVAYLLKPFRLVELEDAMELALATVSVHGRLQPW